MPETDDLNRAIGLAAQGKRAEARRVVLRLEPLIAEPQLRLQLIDLALNVLDNLRDNKLKVALSVEGERLSEAFARMDLQAHFSARTAEYLGLEVSIWHHRRSMLNLTPDWFQFATEAERTEYESLTVAINNRQQEIDGRLSSALALSAGCNDKKARASILMSMGHIESGRYMRCKMDCMRGARAKVWNRFAFMRYPLFEYLLTFSNGDTKRLKRHAKAFVESFLEAARLTEGMNDSFAGYAYNNLAIHLRSTYRFRTAMKYVRKARAIAQRCNDAALLARTADVEKIVLARNKDIPNYLAGETRELV